MSSTQITKEQFRSMIDKGRYFTVRIPINCLNLKHLGFMQNHPTLCRIRTLKIGDPNKVIISDLPFNTSNVEKIIISNIHDIFVMDCGEPSYIKLKCSINDSVYSGYAVHISFFELKSIHISKILSDLNEPHYRIS